jgi:hypothetical protein
MPKYKVTVTHHDRTRWILLAAANKHQAELRAWERLNPDDKDWGYAATWVVEELTKEKCNE